MFSEICLAIIAFVLMIAVLGIIVTCLQLTKSLRLLQGDIHTISEKLMIALDKLNHFLETDAHAVSEDVKGLISNLKNLSTDIQEDVDSLHSLFHPIGSHNSELDSKVSSPKIQSTLEKIPEILRWIASSVMLIKKTKEFIKHEK